MTSNSSIVLSKPIQINCSSLEDFGKKVENQFQQFQDKPQILDYTYTIQNQKARLVYNPYVPEGAPLIKCVKEHRRSYWCRTLLITEPDSSYDLIVSKVTEIAQQKGLKISVDHDTSVLKSRHNPKDFDLSVKNEETEVIKKIFSLQKQVQDISNQYRNGEDDELFLLLEKPLSQEVEQKLRKVCSHCNKANSKAKLCGRCKMVRYCNVECQKAAWATHQKVCQFLIQHFEGNG